MGFIELEDELKPDAKTLIDYLNEHHIKSALLTGDNNEIGQKVSAQLGLTYCYSQLLPQEKFDLIKAFKAEQKIAYIGDGINDSLALTAANVGIAMGKGSDLAILSADVVISNDHLSKVIGLFKIARKTRRVAIQNIVFALSIKTLILVLGILGFANMWSAIVADVGVSLIAILNAIKILKMKL